MRVRITRQVNHKGEVLEVGQERSFPDDEAKRLLEGRVAVPVREQVVERAVIEPAPERAESVEEKPAPSGRTRKAKK